MGITRDWEDAEAPGYPLNIRDVDDDRERPEVDGSLNAQREAEGRCSFADRRKEDCGGLNEGSRL